MNSSWQIKLGVPLIGQEKSMSCWHASARMIWAYKYKQCIHPMPALYQANTGLAMNGISTLANSLGLETIRQVNYCFSADGLKNLLEQYGPLWAAGIWYEAGHVVVVTGINNDGTIYINDPAQGGQRKKMTLMHFNEKLLSNHLNPIMYLPNGRANASGFDQFWGN